MSRRMGQELEMVIMQRPTRWAGQLTPRPPSHGSADHHKEKKKETEQAAKEAEHRQDSATAIQLPQDRLANV
ncbi:hypothetical protein GCM10023213_23780 [Prosthecobacter algae]|uniref:Uncharacterized protein n=1 Tax=Prosthecobacter algae TaxID=1144682 RepID=A0ABP9P5S8_9BACT